MCLNTSQYFGAEVSSDAAATATTKTPFHSSAMQQNKCL